MRHAQLNADDINGYKMPKLYIDVHKMPGGKVKFDDVAVAHTKGLAGRAIAFGDPRSYLHVISLAIILALPVIVIATAAIFRESHHHIPFPISLFVPGIL